MSELYNMIFGDVARSRPSSSGGEGLSDNSQQVCRRRQPGVEALLGDPLVGSTRNNNQEVGNYYSNAENYRPLVSAQDDKTIDRLKKLGIHSHCIENKHHTNAHAVSAAVRSYLTAYGLGKLYALGYRKGMSLYSSSRDITLNNLLNRRVPKNQQFNLATYRPLVVPGDIARIDSGTRSVSLLDVENFDGAYLMVDIYHGLDGGPLRPQSILSILATNQHLCWIGHRFNGCFGTIFEEGGWYRPFTGDVISRPDENLAPYKHDPCDWIWGRNSYQCERSKDFLVWVALRSVGDVYVVLFQRVQEIVAFVPPEVSPSSRVVEYTLYHENTATISSWIRPLVPDFLIPHLFPSKKLHLYEPLFQFLRESIDPRIKNSLTFKQALDGALRWIKNDQQIQLLQKLYPSIFGAEWVKETCFYAFYIQASSDVNLLTTYRSVHGEYVEQSNGLLGEVDKSYVAPTSRFLTVLRLISFVLGVKFLMRILPRKFLKKILMFLLRISKTVIFGQSEVDITMDVVFPFRAIFNLEGPFGLLSLRDHVPDLMKKIINVFTGQDRSWILNEATYPKFVSRYFQHYAPILNLRLVRNLFLMWNMSMHSESDKPVFLSSIFLSPLLEEIFKHMPHIHSYITGAIVALETARNCKPFKTPEFRGSIVSKVLMLFLPGIFHFWTASMPFWKAYIFHFLWNCNTFYWQELLYDSFVKPNEGNMLQTLHGVCFADLGWVAILILCYYLWPKDPLSSPYERFRQVFYFEPWSCRAKIPVDYIKEVFDERLSITPVAQRSHFEPSPFDPTLKIQGHIADDDFDFNRSVYWWFLPTNVPGYVPGHTNANLGAVLKARLLVKPPLAPADQASNWLDVPVLVDQEPAIVRENHVEEWFLHFENDKRKRYKHALSLYNQSPDALLRKALRKVKVMVKKDELLMKFENDVPCLKPRAIANVDPIVQVQVGPEIYRATQLLKQQWGLPLKMRDCLNFRVSLVYAGAATDQFLTDWLYEARLALSEPSAHIIVSGDDSLVLANIDNSFIVYEGDASMFDQSQSTGPLEHEYKTLRTLGVSQLTVDVLSRLSRAPYVAYYKDFLTKTVIDRTLRPMRDTGGADTSIGNSVNMGHAWAYALTCLVNRHVPLLETFSKLGFKMKLKTYRHITEATFLKGMWYCVNDPKFYYWGPLPSRVLKIGKSLKDPRGLYKEKDLKKATALFLNDIASSYSQFLQVPLLRVFVCNFNKTAVIRREYEAWKVQASIGPKPSLAIEAFEQICLRYGIEMNDLKHYEENYPDAPFTFYSHFVNYRLALIDYC